MNKYIKGVGIAILVAGSLLVGIESYESSQKAQNVPEDVKKFTELTEERQYLLASRLQDVYGRDWASRIIADDYCWAYIIMLEDGMKPPFDPSPECYSIVEEIANS